MNRFSIVFPLAGLFASLVLGCNPPEERADEGRTAAESALESSDTPRIRFKADWGVVTTGKLMSGRKVRIDYDANRMPSCRGDLAGGRPGWTVTAHYRFAGGETKSITAAGHSPSGPLDPTIEIPAAMEPGDLEIWFENVSRWGCQAWDSNYGDNFHFSAAPPPEAPSWMGNVRYAATRYTCGSGACDRERHALADTFTFESWARQRASVSEVTFQVYEPGVTDRANAEAWRQLDVKIHKRWRRSGEFTSSYVAIDERVGNDIQYRVDVRPWDPFRAPGALSRSDCPDADLERDGNQATAVVEFYFTVNGVELRPAPGKTFKGKFQVIDQPWSICLP